MSNIDIDSAIYMYIQSECFYWLVGINGAEVQGVFLCDRDQHVGAVPGMVSHQVTCFPCQHYLVVGQCSAHPTALLLHSLQSDLRQGQDPPVAARWGEEMEYFIV